MNKSSRGIEMSTIMNNSAVFDFKLSFQRWTLEPTGAYESCSVKLGQKSPYETIQKWFYGKKIRKFLYFNSKINPRKSAAHELTVVDPATSEDLVKNLENEKICKPFRAIEFAYHFGVTSNRSLLSPSSEMVGNRIWTIGSSCAFDPVTSSVF